MTWEFPKEDSCTPTTSNLPDLPPEIWNEIFALAIDTTTFSSKKCSSPLVLSTVCPAWKAILIAQSKFWSTIHMHFTMWSPRCLAGQVDYLNFWMSSAQGLPLSVKLSFVDYAGNPFNSTFDGEVGLDILRTVARYAGQIWGLESTLPISWLQYLLECITFPNLSSLALGRPPITDRALISDPSFHVIRLIDIFPRLEELAVETLASDLGIEIPWRELTKVTASRLDPTCCLSVFTRAPSLRCVAFHNLPSTHGRGQGGDFNSASSDVPVISPRKALCLENLSLSSSPGPPFCVARILQSMTALPIRQLRLKSFSTKHKSFWMYEDHVPGCHSFLSKVLPAFGSSLHQLCLVDSVFEEGVLVDILAMLPQSRQLEVDTLGLRLTDTFLGKLRSPTMLPHLQSLVLAGLLVWSEAAFLLFIGVRCRIPGNITSQSQTTFTCTIGRMKLRYRICKAPGGPSDDMLTSYRTIMKHSLNLTVVVDKVGQTPRVVVSR